MISECAGIGAAAWALSKLFPIDENETAAKSYGAGSREVLLSLAPQLTPSIELRPSTLERGDRRPSSTICELALFTSETRLGSVGRAQTSESRSTENEAPLKMIFQFWMRVLR